ncbi:MAG: diaminopimelate epimerase [Rikenellaceae bacterium]
MEDLKFIMCHGSANRFVMIDAISQPFSFEGVDVFVREVCAKCKSDGVLFLVKWGDDDMAMRMFNTDGSEAEMCGNGMRCIARLADEEYLHSPKYMLYSGGQQYPIMCHEPLAEGVPAYGVEISIRTASDDFTLIDSTLSDSKFIAQQIEELDDNLTFTYLNLGNPHIVTQVESIDYDHLVRLGERVKQIKSVFPKGVNVSMMQHLEGNKIFVATFERGVGLTASCGTAMTASSTTASLLGLCEWDADIEVRNRGGFVRCRTHNRVDGLVTELIGNATYEYYGRIHFDPTYSDMEIIVEEECMCEQASWNSLVGTI